VSDLVEATVSEAGRFRAWGATHRGAVREHNQDRFVNRSDLGLWAVADGAGGHADGDYAASLIAESLNAIPRRLAAGELLAMIRLRLQDVHARLNAPEEERTPPPASTVVVLVAHNDHFACLWAGDSRAYLLRDGRMDAITRDHSLVQELVDAGALAPEAAEGHPQANVITRAIGAGGDLLLYKVMDRLRVGDRFLLCTDGLFKTLDGETIHRLLQADEDSPAERLVMAALAAQSRDNVTAVAVLVGSTHPAEREEMVSQLPAELPED
jgi:serine/threonine protein phosphatase Stp1